MICNFQPLGDGFICSECGWQALAPIVQECKPLGPRPVRFDPSCLHRGEQLREEGCPACTGSVRLKVYRCDVHGECTIGTKIDGAACCFPRDGEACADRCSA